MNERNLSKWSFVLALYGLILTIVFFVMELTHADFLFLAIVGLLCGLGVCFGSFLGRQEAKRHVD